MSLLECSRVGKRTKVRKLEPPGTLIQPPYLSLWQCGIQNQKYKNWETSTDAYTAEDYAGFQETWNAGMAE